MAQIIKTKITQESILASRQILGDCSVLLSKRFLDEAYIIPQEQFTGSNICWWYLRGNIIFFS